MPQTTVSQQKQKQNVDSTLWLHCFKNSEERWRYITSTETIIQLLQFPD